MSTTPKETQARDVPAFPSEGTTALDLAQQAGKLRHEIVELAIAAVRNALNGRNGPSRDGERFAEAVLALEDLALTSDAEVRRLRSLLDGEQRDTARLDWLEQATGVQYDRGVLTSIGGQIDVNGGEAGYTISHGTRSFLKLDSAGEVVRDVAGDPLLIDAEHESTGKTLRAALDAAMSSSPSSEQTERGR